MAALGAGKTDACRAANHFNEGWVGGYGRGSIFENDDSYHNEADMTQSQML